MIARRRFVAIRLAVVQKTVHLACRFVLADLQLLATTFRLYLDADQYADNDAQDQDADSDADNNPDIAVLTLLIFGVDTIVILRVK